MTKARCIMVLIIYSIIGIVKAQTTIDWQADLSYIAKELTKKHCNLFAYNDEKYFLAQLDTIKENINQKNDLEVALQIQQLLTSMGDSHTTLNYKSLLDKRKVLPLQLYYFKDGLFVLCTSQNYRELVGCRIMSINNIPLNVVEQKISIITGNDNNVIIKKDAPQFIPLTQLLHYLNIKQNKDDKGINIEYQSQDGKIKNITLHTNSVSKQKSCIQPSFKSHEQALCYKNQKQLFTLDYLKEEKMLYIQYNRCWSKELEIKAGNKHKADKFPSFEEFENNVFQTLETKGITKIVFDIRFNSGGNSLQGTQFIEKLSNYLENRSSVKTYVVLGRHTFSSAILNALDFKKLIPNTIYLGEETSGKPNHFGELRYLLLPSSKLQLFYSTKYFKRVDEDTDSLYPDIKIESTFSDFMKGIDPVYEWVKNN